MVARKAQFLAHLIILILLASHLASEAQPASPAIGTISSESGPEPVGKILSHIDLDGVMLQYSDRSMLQDYIQQKLVSYREYLNFNPSLATEKGRKIKEQIAAVSDLFTNEILEGILGVASSVKPSEGFFVRKSFLAAQDDCPILRSLAFSEPVEITLPATVPADTDLLVYQELDPERLVERCVKLVNDLHLPGIGFDEGELRDRIREFTNGECDLSELGTHFAIVVRTGRDTMILPGSGVSAPKLQLAVLLFPPDDRLAKLLAEGVSRSEGTVPSELEGFKIYSKSGDDPLLSQMILVIGNGLLFLGSDEQLARDLIKTKLGKLAALSKSAEFERLADKMPANGNSYYYTSSNFESVIRSTVEGLETSLAGSLSVPQRVTALNTLLFLRGFGRALNGFSVSAKVDGGYYTVMHSRTGENVDLISLILVWAPAINAYLTELLQQHD